MKDVQLITYPDSLGGSLAGLDSLLGGSLQGLFPGGVHILPPFPSTGDRGFAPVTYHEIDPSFGTWNDMERIAEKLPVMVDVMVNHISSSSRYFRDYLLHGSRSAYADMFIPLEKIWPDGRVPREDIEKLSLRRSSPFSRYTLADGKETVLWTTFGRSNPSDQVDVDVFSPVTRSMLAETLQVLGSHGVGSVRLDAAAYVTKQAGTDCFFLEPTLFDFLSWIEKEAKASGMNILPEIHAPLDKQRRLTSRGYASYDFVSPFLILDALESGSPRQLVRYIRKRPAPMITMLDCHDGVPVYPDVRWLISPEDIRRTVAVAERRGANFSRLHPDSVGEDGIAIHQINGTYFSLLDCNEEAYLAARALQLFLPGTPQVYYLGLLMGKNSSRAMEEQGDGRAVNRRNYPLSEVETALRGSAAERQMELIRLRNTHPAFSGELEMHEENDQLELIRRSGPRSCALTVSFRNASWSIQGD